MMCTSAVMMHQLCVQNIPVIFAVTLNSFCFSFSNAYKIMAAKSWVRLNAVTYLWLPSFYIQQFILTTKNVQLYIKCLQIKIGSTKSLIVNLNFRTASFLLLFLFSFIREPLLRLVIIINTFYFFQVNLSKLNRSWFLTLNMTQNE